MIINMNEDVYMYILLTSEVMRSNHNIYSYHGNKVPMYFV